MIGSLLHSICNGVTSLMMPLHSRHPLLGMAAITLVSAILALLGYRYASPQARIRRAKSLMKADLISTLLFKDSLIVAFRTAGHLVVASVGYILLNLLPLVVLAPIIGSLLICLDPLYGWETPAPNQGITFSVTLSPGVLEREPVRLIASKQVRVETPALRAPQQQQVSWRVSAKTQGRHQLTLEVGKRCTGSCPFWSTTKRLDCGTPTVSTLRAREDQPEVLLFAGEPPLEATSPIRQMQLYPEPAEFNLLGWQAHWLYAYLLLTLLWALLLRRFFGVTF